MTGRRLGAGLCALLVAACTRGKSQHKDEEKAGPPAASAAKSAAAPEIDPDWRDGRLPPSVQEGTPADGGTLVVRLPQEPAHLVHLIESDWWLSRMIDTPPHVVEALITSDFHDHPRYRMMPRLAERFEISPDKLVYTFFLRKGVKWHDGKPFTADDVIFTFDRLMDPKVKSMSLRNYFQDLKRWQKLDDHTVRLVFAKPYFLQLDIIESVGILPKHVYGDGDFNNHPRLRSPVGTGPFKLEKWEPGVQIVFVRNEEYWGPKPHLDRIVYRVVNDNTVAKQLLERGEIDLELRLTPEEYLSLANNPKMVEQYRRIRFFDANYGWVGFNANRPLFQDRRVRRALTDLFNLEAFHRDFWKGLWSMNTCHFYFEGPDCDPGLKPPPYDPQKARELLAEAGWKDTDRDGVLDKDGKPFKFTFLFSVGSTYAEQLGTIWKYDLERAGIQMEMQKLEWAAYLKRIRDRDFDVNTQLWGGGPRSDPYQIWHSSQNTAGDGSNYVGFANPEADRLIMAARPEFDDAKRSEIYKQFGRILYDEQPYLWLGTRPMLGAVHRKFKGVEFNLNFWRFDEWWIDPAWQAPAQGAPN